MVYGLYVGVLSVTGVYVETYAYDDIYVHVFMMSSFCTSYHIFL